MCSSQKHDRVRDRILQDHIEQITRRSPTDKSLRAPNSSLYATLEQRTGHDRSHGTHCLPGALTETDLLRFKDSTSQLDESTQNRLLSELDSTIQGIAEFFYDDTEISEEQRKEMAWVLPEQIKEHHELLMADAADLETRRKRIQQLVDDINEIHPRLHEELKHALLTFPPSLDKKRSASRNLLAGTIETSLLKSAIMRARVHKSLYGHKSQSNLSITISQALEAAYEKLKNDERKLDDDERALDRQLEEYQGLLTIVDGRGGAFSQIVEDWTRVQRESDECRRDLRRLGWSVARSSMHNFHDPTQMQFPSAKSSTHDIGVGCQNPIACCTLPNVSLSDRRSIPFAACGSSTETTRFSHSDLRSSAVGSAICPEPSTQCATMGMPSCADCVTECTQPTCTATKLTPHCTKECVLTPCNDFSHVDMNCPGDVDEHPCDFVTNCTDCGLEDFPQCCTEDHSRLFEPGTYPPYPWGFDAFLCGCGDLNANTNTNMTDEVVKPFASLNNDTGFSSDAESSGMFHWEVPTDATTTFTTPTSSASPRLHYPAYSPRNSTPDIIQHNDTSQPCKWDGCRQSFSGLSELAKHLHFDHLLNTSPTQSVEPTTIDISHNQLHSQDVPPDLSCHWGDCSAFPSLESIPGPSNDHRFDAARGILASHLLQDHLGLPIREPSLVSSHAPVLLQKDESGVGETPQPKSPLQPPHECSGIHVCRWRSCEEAFSSCEELTEHIVAFHVGAGKAHYECFWKDCNRHGDRGFSSKQKICRHLQSHTGHRPFRCKVCGQSFSEAATLQQHIRRHTQEKPYVCDVPGCGKAFAITGALTIHKRTHNGQKPFNCMYCGRAFAESSNLSKHLRTHTGDRPYVCAEETCGKSFARPDQLNRHMSVHRKKLDTIK